MAEGGQKEPIVAHDDMMTVLPKLHRMGGLRQFVCVVALSRTDLRFDVCSEVGMPTSDYSEIFNETRFPSRALHGGAREVVALLC